MPPDPHVLLLTGAPGVGKTTVIRAVAGALSGRRLAGFITEEIRAGRERRGFALVTVDGRRARMADVSRPGAPRVGRYGVDVEVIDGMARPALAVREDVELYLVDEIGKMECLSRAFVEAMRALLDTAAPVVATVAARGGGFIEEVKRRRGAVVWEVTRSNRDAMPARVVDWAEPRLPTSGT
jgi:nucleoside-triphosphatase